MRLPLKELATVLLLGSLLSAESISAPGARTGQWQISLIPSYTNSLSMQFEGGAVADINSHSGFAIGIGYNISDHLEMDLDIGSADGNYTGTRILDDGTSEKYTGSFYTSHLNLGLTYNLLASRFTPFVKGNFGMTYIDSGIPTGNVDSTCWWDPWWGYYCGYYPQSYTSSDFSYGADAGLRFDITSNVFLKGSVGKSYIDFNNSSTADFTIYKFIVGFSFK